MKIAQVFSTPWPPTEGIATYVYGLSKELLKQGHEVVLFTRGRRTRRYHDADLGVDVVEIRTPPLNPFHVHLEEPAFRRYVKTHDMQDWKFHIHTPYPPIPPKDVPYLLTVHTPMVPDSASIKERTFGAFVQKAQSRFLKHRETRILRHASRITAVSAQVALELADYGVDPATVQVVGNAVDTDRFKPVPNPTRDYFLYVGRLGPRKGLEDLLDACRMLHVQGVAFKLKITGRGPLRPLLEQRVRDYGLGASVEFLGLVPKEDLPGLYANAKAVVIPSHYEGLPTVLLEAMASGAPVVATDIPGIREVVPRSWLNSLVQIADAGGLANAMRSSFPVEGGRNRVLQAYVWPQLAERLTGIPSAGGPLQGVST